MMRSDVATAMAASQEGLKFESAAGALGAQVYTITDGVSVQQKIQQLQSHPGEERGASAGTCAGAFLPSTLSSSWVARPPLHPTTLLIPLSMQLCWPWSQTTKCTCSK